MPPSWSLGKSWSGFLSLFWNRGLLSAIIVSVRLKAGCVLSVFIFILTKHINLIQCLFQLSCSHNSSHPHRSPFSQGTWSMNRTTRSVYTMPYATPFTTKKSMVATICAVASMVTQRLPGTDHLRYVEIKHVRIDQLAFLGHPHLRSHQLHRRLLRFLSQGHGLPHQTKPIPTAGFMYRCLYWSDGMHLCMSTSYHICCGCLSCFSPSSLILPTSYP